MTDAWLEKSVVIKNKSGLHMRPIQKIVELASKFKSEIRAAKEPMECSAKNILEMLDFAHHVFKSTEGDNPVFTFRASGEDAQAALDALSDLIENRFGLE